MSDIPNDEKAALLLTAEENYAHARDHENLRAQVTATLVAAAFILVGLAIDKGAVGSKLIYVSVLSILIGTLNVVVVAIHNNRFERHVSIARAAKRKISTVEVGTDVKKLLSLSLAWIVVACLPIIAGIGLLLLGSLPSVGASTTPDQSAVQPNPSIERTSPGEPGAASHVKR